MAAPYSRIKIKTVANTSFIALPLAKPEYFGKVKKFNLRIKWGDGRTNVYLNDYDHDFLDWNRDYDTSGTPSNQVPQADSIVVPFHSYESPGQYTIEIFGGFDDSHGADNNDDQTTLKFAFAAAEDRMELSEGEGENKVITRLCAGTPDKIEEIFGIGNPKNPRGDLFIHGQGDFEDFTNLKKISCSLKLLKSIKSSSDDGVISYSDNNLAKVCFINTFKNTESLEETTQIQRLLSGSPQVINMEGCFDNSAYNGFLAWNTSEVKNFNRTFRKSKNTITNNFNTSAAESIDYMFEDSYSGRAFKIFKKLYKGEESAGASFWKLVLADDSENTLWSNDGSVTIGSTVEEPTASVRLVTAANGRTKNDFYIGDAAIMDPISPDAFVDPSKSNDFYTNAKLHFWTSSTSGGAYAKQEVTNLDFNSSGMIINNANFLIGEWTSVKSAVGTFKDHKKLDPNLLRRAFSKNKDYPIETLEACFEGTNFMKSRRNFKLRFSYAKPKSLSKYIRNSRNAFDIRFIDTSRLEDVSHLCEDTDYDQNIPFNFENVTDASYAFAGCTGNPYLHSAFKKRGNDGKNFKLINVEGMFEGSSGWSGQSWPWKHMKPTSLERTFKDCDFDGELTLGDTKDCTSLNSTFNNSSFTSTKTNITTWNVSNVEDASYCFKSNNGEWNLASWFSGGKDCKIKNVTGFFESSKNKTVCNGWATVFSKTVVSANAMFKNNKEINFDDIVKIFRNTSKNSVLENIDEIFRGIKIKAGEPDSDQKRFLKQWYLAKPECNQHINVFKGVAFGGQTSYGNCRFKSYESNENQVVEPVYQKKNLYSSSSVVYRTICSRKIEHQGEYDTVFMKVG